MLSFPRSKGKGADRPPRESTAELDRQYPRTSSSRAISVRQHDQPPPLENTVIPSSTDGSANEVAEFDHGHIGDSNVTRTHLEPEQEQKQEQELSLIHI